MEQVAIPRFRVSGSSARQLTACLRLSRGASSQATWLLEDLPGGTSLQIGADATCDWQIRAACVPKHALTAMMIGGTLFMKSAQEGGVLLNGKPLPPRWTEVAGGARVDIGLSRIDIALGEARSAFERLPQVYVPAAATAPELPYESGPHAAWRDDSETNEPVEPSAYADAPPESGRPSLVERLSRPSLLEGAPSLLDERMSESSSPALWKFAMCGLVTAIAYAGWLILLDHL